MTKINGILVDAAVHIMKKFQRAMDQQLLLLL